MERALNNWAVRIILPAALTMLLFLIVVFLVIIPTLHGSLMDRKREMCRTMTEATWHVLDYFHNQELQQHLTKSEAQRYAIDQIKSMRYGPEGKDYFWINDMHPMMVMHPYLPELDGTDLTDWADPQGKHLFVEFVDVVKADGEGYVDYMWQWKDDPDVIAQKVSFVKGYEPWGWIIGTGIYIDDVEREINALSRRMVLVCGLILLLVAGLLTYTILQSLQGERKRQRAEHALRDNLRYLAQVINTTSEGFWMVDPAGRIKDVNRSLTDMLGYPEEDLVGTRPEQYFVAGSDPRPGPEQAITPFALGHPVEMEMQRADGSKLNVLVHGSALAESGSLSQGIFAFLTDITQLKEVEQRLRESQERYRRLVETAPVGIVIHRNEVIEFANQTLCRLFGAASQRELQGRRISDFLTPESADLARQRISLMTSTRAILPPVMMDMVRDDGSALFAETASSTVTHAGETAVLTVLLDRTERREFEQEIQRLFTAIEQSEDAFIITDGAMNVLYVNRAIAGFSPLTVEGFKGRHLDALLAGGQPEVLAEMKQALDNTEVWRGRIEVPTVDGGTNRLDMTVSPVVSPAGDVRNYVAVVRDVTREAELERKLRQSQKLEAIGTLAGGIAHDFNNILYAIIGYSDMALDELDDVGFPYECVQEIITAATRAAGLVKQILSFARQSEQAKAQVEILPIIKEVLKLIRSTLPSNIQIRQDLPDSRATIYADPTELHQVLMNLCTNGAQAMLASGGALTVTLREVEVDEETVSQHPQLVPGPHVLISIGDTGPGIPPDIADRIFEPFFTTKDFGQGTGMGLSVVHGIVTALNGIITVYNEPDAGATFNIYLPVAPGEPFKAEHDETGLVSGSEHILIVDDEEIIVTMLRQMLLKLGYRVSSFTDSGKALTAILADPQRFDVVITDQTMPDITGDVLARRILEARPEIPVILATGFSHTITEEQAGELGIRAFLHKPVFKSDLARTLRQVLDSPD